MEPLFIRDIGNRNQKWPPLYMNAADFSDIRDILLVTYIA